MLAQARHGASLVDLLYHIESFLDYLQLFISDLLSEIGVGGVDVWTESDCGEVLGGQLGGRKRLHLESDRHWVASSTCLWPGNV